MISQASPHLILPPERFYWAVLDGSALTKVSKRDQQLGYLFESFLPIPIDEVQAVYQRVSKGTGEHKIQGGGEYVACGMDRQSLRTELDAAEYEGVTLSPASLPPFLASHNSVQPQTFNLLRGAFEPSKVTNLRKRWQALLLATVILMIGVVILGFQRRKADYAQAARKIADDTQTIFRETFGELALIGGQPPELRLTAELRQLRQTRHEPVAEVGLVDVTPILTNLLAHWPSDLFVQTESISITPTAITVRGTAPTSSDVQLLADALQSLEGWQLQQPQMSASNQIVQATLQLRRNENELDQGRNGGGVQ